MARAESEDVLRSRMYRLCGFAVVVVKVRRDDLRGELAGFGRRGDEDSSDLDQLVGAECSLQGRGLDVHVRVGESGLCLRPLVAEDVLVDEERGHNLESGREIGKGSVVSYSPQIACGENLRDSKLVLDEVPAEVMPSAAAGVGSGGKRKRASGNGSREGFLHQMQWLSAKNNARVQGRILTVARKADEIRVLAMLDLYLPPSAWMGTGFWKSGAAAAAALSHLRSVIIECRVLFGGYQRRIF